MAKQNSQLYATLKDYKRAVDTPTRRQARSRIAALVARFIRDHGACIEAIGGAWDVITHVPSTSGRAGIHPLAQAFELVPGLDAQHETLLNRASGAVAHQMGDDEAFVVTRDVTDLRVLLIDDTWTTGARAQSAASALTLAGATVVAIVVVGRLISGDRDDDWYEDQRALGFDFDKCCVHIP
jgi:orotate phosphoribosyltransferase